MKSRLALLIGLGFALAISAAPLARAEEPEQVAQAGASDPRPAAPDPDAEPDPAAEPDPDPKPGTATDPAVTPDPAATQAPAAQPPPPPSSIEEIIVKGTESEAATDFENADSVTGFGAEDLAAIGAQDIADLAAFTPNLEIVTAGATTPTFFIRGVGLNDFNANSTGAVAIYQDDVPINAPALQLSTLFDVEAVNVLRGPQGTGLARNASAGAIKLYARKPTGEFGGFLRSELGNYNLRDFEGAVEAPIYEDMLAARLAFRFTERDGTMKNRCGNAPTHSQRTIRPFNTGPLGKTDTDAPWSICGEPVGNPIPGFGDTNPFPGFSDIPEGLPSWVNNVNNWAARGTLLFQPTLDMTWLINAHGAKRDEWSRLGQSIGTSGFTCKDGMLERCVPGSQPRPLINQIPGTLGGPQFGDGYMAPEIKEMLLALAPCRAGHAAGPGFGFGFPGLPGPGTCDRPPGQPGSDREGNNRAKQIVAKELARNLDSRPWEGDFNFCSTRTKGPGGPYIDRDATGTRCNKEKGKTFNDTWGSYLEGTMVLPTGMQLTSITGFDHYNRTIDIDLDMSPETLFEIQTDDFGWDASQGLQLSGELGDEGSVRWDIGGWLLGERLNVRVINDLGVGSAFAPGTRDYVQDLLSTAGYASLAFDFWDDFTLDGGFRYNWENKKLDYSLTQAGSLAPLTQQLDDTWSAPTGTVRLTYRFREDTHAYWKYTRGWKPGTYNATSAPDTGVSIADPEVIDAFETGLRGSWLDGRLGLDFSLFYYDYTDYQIFIAQQFAGGQPEFVIINANSAEVYGAEIDAIARPWPGAFANVRFGWLESEFLDFVQIQQETVVIRGEQVTLNRELQNTGNSLLNSPRFKVSLTGEQTIPLGRWGSLTARYDGVWTDTVYYDATEGFGLPNSQDVQYLPDETIAQKPFWLHNLRLAYRPPGGRIEIAGWVRNLTNEAYKTFAFDASTFNETSIYFVGDPRTFGGTIIVNF